MSPPKKFPIGFGKNFPGANASSLKPAPSRVNWLNLFSPAPAPAVRKGRYAPDRARTSFWADLDVIVQDLQLPIGDQSLVDQIYKHLIIIKLFYREKR